MADGKELAKYDCHNGQGGGTKEDSGNNGGNRGKTKDGEQGISNEKDRVRGRIMTHLVHGFVVL